MNVNKILLDRVNHLINLAGKTLSTRQYDGVRFATEYVSSELFKEFESSSLSFIIKLFGENHPYFVKFKDTCSSNFPSHVESARGIINSIKTEIENGWLAEIKTLISAEIFSDFLDMSKCFLEEGYKDPSAVMLGSILEENLRQIAQKNSIAITFINNKGEEKPKKADVINTDITKAGLYNMVVQKQVTAWLEIRNKAAHGEYGNYDIKDVDLMYSGLVDFITKHNC